MSLPACTNHLSSLASCLLPELWQINIINCPVSVSGWSVKQRVQDFLWWTLGSREGILSAVLLLCLVSSGVLLWDKHHCFVSFGLSWNPKCTQTGNIVSSSSIEHSIIISSLTIFTVLVKTAQCEQTLIFSKYSANVNVIEQAYIRGLIMLN